MMQPHVLMQDHQLVGRLVQEVAISFAPGISICGPPSAVRRPGLACVFERA